MVRQSTRERTERTRLVLDLSSRLREARLSWDDAARVLGLDNVQLARLLTYRFRSVSQSDLREFIDRIPSAASR